MSEKAHGLPTKEFFVNMITKDIALEDCILDLLDNCIDGVRRDNIRSKNKNRTEDEIFKDYFAYIHFNDKKFIIDDNCGGINLDEAIDYAFHFGRRKEAPKISSYSIGLYGIGMKRAIFKIGKNAIIESTTQNNSLDVKDSFKVIVDVDKWLDQDDTNWDFDIDPLDNSEIGVKVTITNIHKAISKEFQDNYFKNRLNKIISRDYSFILQKGFQIYINNIEINPFIFQLRQSREFSPVQFKYKDETGVSVEISAGLSGLPPEDNEPSSIQKVETEYYGWFVACNDRVVIPSDKTTKTIWGKDGFPVWHVQYNGFIGIINFKSDDPSKLPWTTTKREIDYSDPLYLRALGKMKNISREWIKYTNSRKLDTDLAKVKEISAKPIKISTLATSRVLKTPKYHKPTVEYTSVTYQAEKKEISKVKQTLGNRFMSNKEAGLKTYKYYIKNEVKD